MTHPRPLSRGEFDMTHPRPLSRWSGALDPVPLLGGARGGSVTSYDSPSSFF
jgi:hypothetical protein